MSRNTSMARDADKYERAQMAAFAGEHLFAYLTAAIAVGLFVLGLLEGFGIIDIANSTLATVGGAGPNAATANMDFYDGLLFLVPAATMAFVAFYFHMTDHHRARDPRENTSQDAGAWAAEHLGAIIMGVTAMALAAIGLLVGFDVFGNNYTFEDGLLWELASVAPAVLSCALHTVRHHQTAAEQDVIIALIEERIAVAPGRAGTTGTQTTSERI